ncbi:MAG: hypothetical protein QOH87_4267, partial [Trebonia sp.]|nr:hypothetical protein [Trebonia sp.]
MTPKPEVTATDVEQAGTPVVSLRQV